MHNVLWSVFRRISRIPGARYFLVDIMERVRKPCLVDQNVCPTVAPGLGVLDKLYFFQEKKKACSSAFFCRKDSVTTFPRKISMSLTSLMIMATLAYRMRHCCQWKPGFVWRERGERIEWKLGMWWWWLVVGHIRRQRSVAQTFRFGDG